MSAFIEYCPKCGSDEYVIRQTVTGTIEERNRFDGTRADNTGLWDSARTKEHKRRYCGDCGTVLPKDAEYRPFRSVAGEDYS